MNKNETIADIRKEAEARFRELLEKHVDSLMHIQAMQQFNHAFDRIEAAVKRERVEVSVHAATSAINLTEEKWKGESGLREAVELCDKIINDGTIVCNCDIVDEARAKIRAALALFTNSPENENSGTDNVTPVNNAACREALADVIDDICFHCDLSEDCKGVPCEKMQKAKAALSAPPRQCDVGTPEEQRARFDKFCRSNSWDEIDGAHCMSSCPLYHGDCSRCEELEWAQMPYTESEVNDGK